MSRWPIALAGAIAIVWAIGAVKLWREQSADYAAGAAPAAVPWHERIAPLAWLPVMLFWLLVEALFWLWTEVTSGRCCR